MALFSAAAESHLEMLGVEIALIALDGVIRPNCRLHRLAALFTCASTQFRLEKIAARWASYPAERQIAAVSRNFMRRKTRAGISIFFRLGRTGARSDERTKSATPGRNQARADPCSSTHPNHNRSESDLSAPADRLSGLQVQEPARAEASQSRTNTALSARNTAINFPRAGA